MSKSFQKILEKHEKADRAYVQDKTLILQRMEEEFENAAEFIAHSAAETCPSFFRLFRRTPLRIRRNARTQKRVALRKKAYDRHEAILSLSLFLRTHLRGQRKMPAVLIPGRRSKSDKRRIRLHRTSLFHARFGQKHGQRRNS